MENLYLIKNAIDGAADTAIVSGFISFQALVSFLLLSKSLKKEGRIWIDILVKFFSGILLFSTYQLGNNFIVETLVNRNIVADPIKFWAELISYLQFTLIFLLSVRSLLKEKSDAKT